MTCRSILLWYSENRNCFPKWYEGYHIIPKWQYNDLDFVGGFGVTIFALWCWGLFNFWWNDKVLKNTLKLFSNLCRQSIGEGGGGGRDKFNLTLHSENVALKNKQYDLPAVKILSFLVFNCQVEHQENKKKHGSRSKCIDPALTYTAQCHLSYLPCIGTNSTEATEQFQLLDSDILMNYREL